MHVVFGLRRLCEQAEVQLQVAFCVLDLMVLLTFHQTQIQHMFGVDLLDRICWIGIYLVESFQMMQFCFRGKFLSGMI